MNDQRIDFDVIRQVGPLRAMRAQWDALWLEAQGRFFQTSGYCLHSFEKIAAPAGHDLHCIVGRSAGQLVLLWPLMTCRKSLWRATEGIGSLTGEPTDVLLDKRVDATTAVPAAWNFMLVSSRADLIHLSRVTTSSALYRCAAGARHVVKSVAETTPIAHLSQQSDWQTFCRSLSGRSRNPPERLWQRLSSVGRLSVDEVDGADANCPALIEWMLLHKQKWSTRVGAQSGWLFTDSTRLLLCALMEDGAPGPGYRLFVLRLDGVPVAINFVLIGRSRIELCINTFDFAYSKLSPGMALIDYCVKWAFERGLDFDFGSGGERYKAFWSGGSTYATTSFDIAATQWGLAGYAFRDALRSLTNRRGQLADGVVGQKSATSAPTTE